MNKFYKAVKAFFCCGLIVIFFSFILSSCGSSRNYIYMQGQFDTAKLSQIKVLDPVIQKADLISIVVYSDNPDATKIYNQQASPSSTPSSSSAPGSNSSSGGAPGSSGYLVDESGNIEFQGLGVIHIEGLTRGQLKELLDSKLKAYLTNPYYTIRFMNNRFTMLGEIAKPGVYNIPNDHINLLEAIGLAGEMTFYGRRDNILIIREQNGKREFGRINILKPDAMISPYFYLQQNDVVIFEQNKKKVDANDQLTFRNISIASSIVATLAIVYSILK